MLTVLARRGGTLWGAISHSRGEHPQPWLTLWVRLEVFFALIFMPTAAAAQLSDVGVGVALNHKQYLDVSSLCCPPLAWATFGEGRWRLSVL